MQRFRSFLFWHKGFTHDVLKNVTQNKLYSMLAVVNGALGTNPLAIRTLMAAFTHYSAKSPWPGISQWIL